MDIFLYQIQYDDKTAAGQNSGFLTFDCRENPEFLKREIAHILKFYDEVVKKGSEQAYFALLSPKFKYKTGLSGQQIKQFIQDKPDQDVYLFNPYPMYVYEYLNVWEHGEVRHPNLMMLTDQLLEKANINFRVGNKHRNPVNQVVYCNYWVAKKDFFDRFIPFIRRLDSTIEQMQSEQKQKYFEDTYYITKACIYPFIFERVISIFLWTNPEIKSLVYNYSFPFLGDKKFTKIEQKFYFSEIRAYIDQWEYVGKPDIIETEKMVTFISNMLYPKNRLKLIRSLMKKINLFRINYLIKQIKIKTQVRNW